MDKNETDVIVVGGGIVGLWTCFQLLKKGQKCKLIEQFQLPHGHGSSFGESRIIRNSYLVEEYAQMMPESFAYWKQLQKTSNKKLLLNTGLISIFPNKNNDFVEMAKNLENMKAPYKVLDSSTMNKIYNGLTTNNDMIGILDIEAGILKADDCIKELKKSILNAGGQIFTNEKVVKIAMSDPHTVIVTTNLQNHSSRKLIIASGPWTNEVLKTLDEFQLPLQVWGVNVRYWKENGGVASVYKTANLPVISLYEKPFVYMIPSYDEHAMIKMCLHPSTEINMNPSDVGSKHDRDLGLLRQVIENYYRGINPTPIYTEHCKYTMSPDNGYIIDFHPKYPQVLIAAGFSGHGFKTAPSVGNILAKMVIGEATGYRKDIFCIQRNMQKTSKL